MPVDDGGSLSALTGAPHTMPSPPMDDMQTGASNGIRSSGKRALMVAAVLLALGGTAFFIFGGSGQTNTTPKQAADNASTAAPTSEPVADATATATATGAAPELPSATASTTAAAVESAAVDDGPRVVTVTSTPSGAIVRENDKVLCNATPCEITFAGESKGSGKRHRLTLLKDGYRPGSAVVSPDATSASDKLKVATLPVRAPTPTTKTPTPPPPATQTPPPPPPPKQPDGYKTSPY